MRAPLEELALQYRRFGSPRLCVLLRREAPYNHKLVERHYRDLGLALGRENRKRLARVRVPLQSAVRANQE